MKIVIEYNTDNAAFDEQEEHLLVLHRAYNLILRGSIFDGELGKLSDSNGNVIGTVSRIVEQEDKPGYIGDRCHICGGPDH